MGSDQYFALSLIIDSKLSSEEGAPVKHSREVRAVDNRTQTPKPGNYYKCIGFYFVSCLYIP